MATAPPTRLPANLLPGPMDGRRRVWRSTQAVQALGAEITWWLGDRRTEKSFQRFTSHLSVLEIVLRRILARLDSELAALPVDGPAGPVYERCRELDRGLATVRRVFEWYATKYDQRRDERYSAALLSADEVVRSCWSEAFESRREQPPTGPLCYVDNRSDAMATRRDSTPTELKATVTELAAELIKELPIPTIALPDAAVREAWWLVLAAHETGHHVHRDLVGGLDAVVKQALFDAVTPMDPKLAEFWPPWSLECFADAFSVVMVGDSATWPIRELQHGTPATLVRMPTTSSPYPPPVVRLALLAELAQQSGAAQARRWLGTLEQSPARTAAERLLVVVPTVAATLLDLVPQVPAIDHGKRQAWARQLTGKSPLISPRNTRLAARMVIAAGVHACSSATEEQLELVHDNLLAVLPTCGSPGVLAARPAGAERDVEAVADRFVDRLVRGDRA